MNIISRNSPFPRRRYDSLDTAWCDALERGTYRFDGHKQIAHHSAPWDVAPGFDPDEVEHERLLGQPTGRDYVQVQDMADEVHPDSCACHICNPREALEWKDMLEAVRAGLVSLNDAIVELGQGFREFLETEDPELAHGL